MKNKLRPLTELVSEASGYQTLQLGLMKQLSDCAFDDREDHTVDGIHQWLAHICVISFQVFPSKTDSVKMMALDDAFIRTIIHVKDLVDLWSESRPAPDEFLCLQAIVELFVRIEVGSEKPYYLFEEEFVAAFLLCAALWNQRRGQHLWKTAVEQVFVRSEIYSILCSVDNLNEVVEKVCNQFELPAENRLFPSPR